MPRRSNMNQFDRSIDRTGTGSIKWDRYHSKFNTDHELLPLWIADTDFRTSEEVISAIRQRVEYGVFGYTFAQNSYLETVAEWFGKRHNLPVQTSWVAATHSVVTALYFSIEELTNPGDKVLILTPSYDPFFAIIHNTGRVVEECPLQTQDSARWELDLERMESAFQQGVRAMIFCNPHNPVGRVWTREELQQVANLCEKYRVYVLSDEIHCDMELFDNRYTSMASFENIRDLTACFTSVGKTFNLAGLCSANLIIPDASLRERITGKLRGAWIMSPNLLSLVAAQAAYEKGETWLNEQITYLEQNSRYVQQFLSENLPGVKLAKHEGTFLLWMDLSSMGMEESELCARIVDTCRLGLGFGSHYGQQYGQFMRLNIGCTMAHLQECMHSLLKLPK